MVIEPREQMNSSKASELRAKQRRLKTNSRKKKHQRSEPRKRSLQRRWWNSQRCQRRTGNDRREVKVGSISWPMVSDSAEKSRKVKTEY